MQKTVALFIVMLLSLVACEGPEEAAKSRYEKGYTKLIGGEPEIALEIFEAIVTDYPESPYGNHGKSIFFNKEGLIYEAIFDNYKVLTDHPDFLPALEMSAILSLQVERPDIAYFSINQYLENGGDKRISFSIEMECYRAVGQNDEIGKSLDQKKTEMAEDPLYLIVLADYLWHSGKPDQSLASCQAAIQKGQNDSGILRKAGNYYRDIGLMDSALTYYEAALNIAPDDFYLKADVAEALINMNYLARAGQLMEELKIRIDDTYRYHHLKAQIYTAWGRPRNAMMEYGKVFPKYSRNPSAMANFCFYKWKSDDRRGGEFYFETALEIVKLNEYPYLAQISMELSEIEMFTKMRRPHKAGPLVELLRDSLAGNFRLQYDFAYLYWFAGADDSLLTIAFDDLDEAASDIPQYMAKAASFYVEMDSLNRAEKMFAGVFKTDKTNITAITGSLDLWIKRKAFDKALEYINSFDEYVSYNPEIASRKLQIFNDLGEYQSAIQFAESLIKIAPNDLDRYKTLVELEGVHGSSTRISEIYQMCLENNPDNPDAYVMVGRHAFTENNIDRAKELAQKATELDRDHVFALILLADIERQGGNNDKAFELYERVGKLDQYAADALGMKAEILLERGENPMVVLNLARKASQYDGTNARHYNTQGRALFAAERYDMARTSFENALRFAPKDPIYNYYAGLNYIKDGKPEEAKKCLQNAVQYGLTGDFKSDAEKALKNL